MAMCETIFDRKPSFGRGTNFGRSTIGMGARGTQFASSLRSEFNHNESFCFRPRAGKLNIRLLHSVDPEQVMVDGDLETIRAHMDNLTFSKIGESDLRSFNDEFLAKLLNLFQLTMEYLYAMAQNDRALNEQLTEANQELQQNMIAMDGKMAVQKSQMQQLYKENKYKTKQLEIYEAMLPGRARASQGQRTSVRFGCPQCGKNFESEQYLNSHIARRHGDTTQDKLCSVVQGLIGTPALPCGASFVAQTADAVPASQAPDVRPSVSPDMAHGTGQTPCETQQQHDDAGRSVPSINLQTALSERTLLEETSKVNDQVVALRQELEDQMSRMREEVSTMVSDLKVPLENKVDSLAKANETLKESLSEQLSFAPALHEQVQDLKALVEAGQRRKSKAGELESDTDSDTLLTPPTRGGSSALPPAAAINTAVESALRSSQQSLLSQISHLQIQSKQHNLRLEELIKDKLLLERSKSVSASVGVASTSQQATPRRNGDSTHITTPSATPPIASNEQTPRVDAVEKTESTLHALMIDKVHSTSVILDSEIESPASAAMMVHSFNSSAPSAVERVEGERAEPSEHGKESANCTSSDISITESKVDEAQAVFFASQKRRNAEQASKWTDGLNNFLDDPDRAKYMISMNFEGALRPPDLRKVLEESQGVSSRALTEQEIKPWAYQTSEPPTASAPVDEPTVRKPEMSSPEASSSGEARASKLATEETEAFAVERMMPIKELEKTVDRAFRSSWNFFMDSCRTKLPVGTNSATQDFSQSINRQEPSIDASQCSVTYTDGSRVTFFKKGVPPKLAKIENGIEADVESFVYDKASGTLADMPSCPEGRRLPEADANRIITALQKLAAPLGVPGLGGLRDVERSSGTFPLDHIPPASQGPLSAAISKVITPGASYTSAEGGSLQVGPPYHHARPEVLQTQFSRALSKEVRDGQQMQNDATTPSFGSDIAPFLGGGGAQKTPMKDDDKRENAVQPLPLWEHVQSQQSSAVFDSPLNNNNLDNSWDMSDGVQPFHMSSTSSPIQRHSKLAESTVVQPQESAITDLDRRTLGVGEHFTTSPQWTPRTPRPIDTITTADNRRSSAAYGSKMNTSPADDNDRWSSGPKEPAMPHVSSVTSFMDSRDITSMGTSSAPACIFNRPSEFSRPPPTIMEPPWEPDDLDLEEIQ